MHLPPSTAKVSKNGGRTSLPANASQGRQAPRPPFLQSRLQGNVDPTLKNNVTFDNKVTFCQLLDQITSGSGGLEARE